MRTLLDRVLAQDAHIHVWSPQWYIWGLEIIMSLLCTFSTELHDGLSARLLGTLQILSFPVYKNAIVKSLLLGSTLS